MTVNLARVVGQSNKQISMHVPTGLGSASLSDALDLAVHLSLLTYLGAIIRPDQRAEFNSDKFPTDGEWFQVVLINVIDESVTKTTGAFSGGPGISVFTGALLTASVALLTASLSPLA